MNENQKWKNLGEEIRNAVEDALRSGDFSGLDDVLSDTVAGTINSVKDQFMGQSAGFHKTAADQRNRAYTPDSAGQSGRETKTDSRAWQDNHRTIKPVPAPFNRVGRVSGTLYQVFGGIGTGVMAILSIIFLALTFLLGKRFGGGLFLFVTLFAVSIGMIHVGNSQKRRLKRAEKYREIAGHKHYINLEDLALHTGKSVKYILKDVKRILKNGFFPEGHLDRQESCLMLDDKIYREYLELDKQRAAQERELKAIKEEVAGEEGNPELHAIIAEGQDYIHRLREMNDNIPGEVISAKLFRLENILKEIFGALREHPEQMPKMQKFMDYYLPTTIKLVGAYEEFDALSVQGEDIREAKSEIEKTLDTINSAFGELLNSLFRTKAYDAETDAQVLKAMLAKEGLTGGLEFGKEDGQSAG